MPSSLSFNHVLFLWSFFAVSLCQMGNFLSLLKDSPIHRAAFVGEIEDLKKLLDESKSSNFDINQGLQVKGLHRGASPLLIASFGGRFEAARVLLDHGADVHSRRNDGWTALHYAANSNDVDVARVLIEFGADVNALMSENILSTPLHFAAKKGFSSVVELLLEFGADASLRKENGQSALDDAASGGFLSVVKLLLDKGNANMYDVNYDMMTAFHFAVFEGHHDVAKEFIMRGMNVNTKRNVGAVAMHDAAAGGNLKMINLLLDNGADINAVNDEGITPIIAAVNNGHLRTVDLLLQRGVDADTKTSGETPLKMVRRFKDQPMENILLRLERKPVDLFTAGDVRHFVASLGLSKYYQTLKDNPIDGPTLMGITTEKLKKLGIETEDAEKIVKNISKLPPARSFWKKLADKWSDLFSGTSNVEEDEL
eukprot:TRINITY_DN7267_c0_g1_i1.p1 TRINITY_DN7267_c0_g1~~TRINITY_DN7267_c0_g1_i1.p1  ORF type:complete len:426 (+),score=87.95 TRINITY_DN7267_c0_g1_i1:57-1334(+)